MVKVKIMVSGGLTLGNLGLFPPDHGQKGHCDRKLGPQYSYFEAALVCKCIKYPRIGYGKMGRATIEAATSLTSYLISNIVPNGIFITIGSLLHRPLKSPGGFFILLVNLIAI